MSRENVEVVRQPVAVKARSRRRLDQRLFLYFPRLAAVSVRAVVRFRPSSRLRQVMIHRALRLAVEAANRYDYEAAFELLGPASESIPPPEIVGLGTDPVGRGRDARVRLQRQFVAQFGEFRNEPEEIIDLGDRVLMVGRMRGSGLASGASFDREVAYLLTISAGRLIREQVFLSHAEALEAVGLRE